MTGLLWAAAIFGGVGGFAIWYGIWRGILGHQREPRDMTWLSRMRDRFTVANIRRWAVAVGITVAAQMMFGVAMMAIIVGAVVGLWPQLAGGEKANKRRLDRLEGLAIWAESLRDRVKGGSSLEEALVRTSTSPPTALYDELGRFGDQLHARVPLRDALQALADELDDDTADLVIGQLMMSLRIRGPHLTTSLSQIAQRARDHWATRRETVSKRVPARRTSRVILGAFALFLVFQWFFANQYFRDPYTTIQGQIVLAAVFGSLGWVFISVRRKNEPPRYRRILRAETPA